MVLKRPAPRRCSKTVSTERMLTMQEAMDYLTDKGVPCKSRATFYRILKDFDIQHVNVNPNGKNAVRRFPPESLVEILEAKGILP